MSDTPQHKLGDIVNAHRLTKNLDGSLVWLPVKLDPKPSGPKWYTRKWVQLVAVGVLAFALGSAIGASGASGASDIKALKADLLETQAKLTTAENDRERALTLADEYADREADLTAREQAVTDREGAVTEAEEVKAANTMVDGAGYIVGVSVEPGVYRTTTATSSCYWGIYTSGTNKDDIVSNDYGTGGTIDVTLAAGQDFESNKCGEWTKVG